MNTNGNTTNKHKIIRKGYRELISTIDPTKSIVTGNGIISPIVNQINNVVLTAKDSYGNNIGIGGETVFIQISNEWTRGTMYFSRNWNKYKWNLLSI